MKLFNSPVRGTLSKISVKIRNCFEKRAKISGKDTDILSILPSAALMLCLSLPVS